MHSCELRLFVADIERTESPAFLLLVYFLRVAVPLLCKVRDSCSAALVLPTDGVQSVEDAGAEAFADAAMGAEEVRERVNMVIEWIKEWKHIAENLLAAEKEDIGPVDFQKRIWTNFEAVTGRLFGNELSVSEKACLMRGLRGLVTASTQPVLNTNRVLDEAVCDMRKAFADMQGVARFFIENRMYPVQVPATADNAEHLRDEACAHNRLHVYMDLLSTLLVPREQGDDIVCCCQEDRLLPEALAAEASHDGFSTKTHGAIAGAAWLGTFIYMFSRPVPFN